MDSAIRCFVGGSIIGHPKRFSWILGVTILPISSFYLPYHKVLRFHCAPLSLPPLLFQSIIYFKHCENNLKFLLVSSWKSLCIHFQFSGYIILLRALEFQWIISMLLVKCKKWEAIVFGLWTTHCKTSHGHDHHYAPMLFELYLTFQNALKLLSLIENCSIKIIWMVFNYLEECPCKHEEEMNKFTMRIDIIQTLVMTWIFEGRFFNSRFKG